MHDLRDLIVNVTPRTDNLFANLQRMEPWSTVSYDTLPWYRRALWRMRFWRDDCRERIAGWIWPYCTCDHEDD